MDSYQSDPAFNYSQNLRGWLDYKVYKMTGIMFRTNEVQTEAGENGLKIQE